MLKRKKTIKIDMMFTYQYMKYIVKELFVADNVRWVRCVDEREENKYFTEREVYRYMIS
jgi:hypothetical protein